MTAMAAQRAEAEKRIQWPARVWSRYVAQALMPAASTLVSALGHAPIPRVSIAISRRGGGVKRRTRPSAALG